MATVVLTVVAAKVAGAETNFPVLITPSLISGLGSISLADAQSSRIYADVTQLVEQAREVVVADEIHTKIAALTTVSECHFDYDGVRADYAVTDTYGRNAVWSDYGFVGHLGNEENSTGGTDLTNDGSTPFGAAKIANGAEFNTTNNRRLSASDVFGLNWSNSFTEQMWVKVNAFVGDKYLLDHWSTTGANNRFILYSSTIGTRTIRAFFNGNELTTGLLSTGVFYKIDAMKDGGTMRAYQNASSLGTTTKGGLTYTKTRFSIGAEEGVFTVNANATIDEVRFRASALSANWITTEYNNQNDNAGFWTTGGGGGPEPTTNFLLLGVS